MGLWRHRFRSALFIIPILCAFTHEGLAAVITQQAAIQDEIDLRTQILVRSAEENYLLQNQWRQQLFRLQIAYDGSENPTSIATTKRLIGEASRALERIETEQAYLNELKIKEVDGLVKLRELILAIRAEKKATQHSLDEKRAHHVKDFTIAELILPKKLERKIRYLEQFSTQIRERVHPETIPMSSPKGEPGNSD